MNTSHAFPVAQTDMAAAGQSSSLNNGRSPFAGGAGQRQPAAEGDRLAQLFTRESHSLYQQDAESLQSLVEQTMRSGGHSVQEENLLPALKAQEQAPIIQLVEAIFRGALDRGASDIHLQAGENGLRVRLRVDGELRDLLNLPKALTPVILSRLKIMAELDICERRIPQDGCIRMRTGEGDADFRISTVPSLHAENIVLRILRRDHLGRTLDQVGLLERDLKLLRAAISKPDGAVLVTGPTGSGKTTTLYAALTELNDPSIGIFTAEDPVEGAMKGITQIQVNSAVGLTFASILRSLLRQDPDVIMIGEIRDRETAEIAAKAALTGHLVLSTLHTNDTASSIERLVNMGVEPYLITSAVNLVIAQRLVRKICGQCKERIPTPPEATEGLKLSAKVLGGAAFYRGAGCQACGKTGYAGRTPIFETMPITNGLKAMILQKAPVDQLKAFARLQGMSTLRQAATALMLKGITTINEVLANTNEDADGELAALRQMLAAKQQKAAAALNS